MTVEKVIDSGMVSNNEVRANSRRHFKTFQRVIASDALSPPPAENHGIKIELLRKTVGELGWALTSKLFLRSLQLRNLYDSILFEKPPCSKTDKTLFDQENLLRSQTSSCEQ